MMTNCPVCNSEVKETAKFCSECGVQLAMAPSERAWIVAMEERIKAARHNDVIYNVTAVVGLVITMTIPFVMRYVLHFTMDLWSWLITGVGIFLFVGSLIGMWYDNRKVKGLIERLEMGEELEEEEDEEEGDDEDDEEEE
jgi:hypothetical protein